MVINRKVLIRLNGFYKDIVLFFTGLYITGKKNRINRFFNCFYRLSTGKEPAGFPENNPVHPPELSGKQQRKRKRKRKFTGGKPDCTSGSQKRQGEKGDCFFHRRSG